MNPGGGFAAGVSPIVGPDVFGTTRRTGVATTTVAAVAARYSFVALRPAAQRFAGPLRIQLINTTGAPVGPVTLRMWADPGVVALPNTGQFLDITAPPAPGGVLPLLRSTYIAATLAALPGAGILDELQVALAINGIVSYGIPSTLMVPAGALFGIFLETVNQTISLVTFYMQQYFMGNGLDPE